MIGQHNGLSVQPMSSAFLEIVMSPIIRRKKKKRATAEIQMTGVLCKQRQIVGGQMRLILPRKTYKHASAAWLDARLIFK